MAKPRMKSAVVATTAKVSTPTKTTVKTTTAKIAPVATAKKPTSTTVKAAPATTAKSTTSTAKTTTTSAKTTTKKSTGLDFIGMFPIRKNKDNKKIDQKKQSAGPVFEPGSYTIATIHHPLGPMYLAEMREIYKGKHAQDTITAVDVELPGHDQPMGTIVRELISKLEKGEVDMVVANVKDIPLNLPDSLQLAAVLRREDPRDVLIARSTYGAIQELPRNSRVCASSRRRLMQVRALREDITFVNANNMDVNERLKKLDTDEADALIVAWATLKRLNISPRFYVSLQSEVMLPAPCQGSIGVLCRGSDENLLAKLRYVEDSEASWASRCERAFILKMGGKPDSPIGALAHRKGTQDPWILDIVVGDPNTGELLRHREIGTSRCKPESLADKAFSGVLAKGARKFLWP